MNTAPPGDDPILFVGDIQGCLKPLEALLKKAKFNPDTHRLIPLGDTINRGPDNIGVLNLLRSLGAEPIRGNHEFGLLKAARWAETEPEWSKAETWQDIIAHPDRDAYLDWIESWPTLRRGRGWIAVHGGVHPTLSLDDTPDRFRVSVRVCDPQGKKPKGWDGMNETIPEGYKPWHHYYDGEDVVLFGHWARKGLQIGPNYRGLDTGAVYGLKLSALWWPEDKLVQVPGQ